MKNIQPKKENQIYIPEIDGLRAVAILAVLINHLNSNYLKSGFFGVDIFFVISGYVITKSVLSHNFINFSEFLKYFFERRFKRLLPALFVYVISISIIICLFNPYPNVSLRTGFFSLIGLSNFYLFKYSTDYFAQASYLNPFMNTWSLSVEEQFYFIFPAIIFFSGLFKNKNRSILLISQIISILSIFSLILFLKNYYVYSSFSYFLIPTRFWEIGFGVMTYITYRKFKAFFNTKLKKISPFIQLILISSLFIILFSENQYAQYKTLLVVLITSYFLISFCNNSPINKILSNKLIVYLGKLSYSLYLWHWGIISLSFWTYGKDYNPYLVLIIIFLTSYISYRFIENPLRRLNWKIFFLGTFKIILLFITFSFLFIYNLGEARKMRYKLITFITKNNIDPESFFLSQEVPQTTINRKNCHASMINEMNSFINIIKKCSYSYAIDKKIDTKNIFLSGDSHSYVLRNLIANLSNKYRANFTSISGTMFPSNIYWYKSKSQPYLRNFDVQITNDYMNYILENANSEDIVIISNRLPTIYSEPINIEQKNIYKKAIFFNLKGESISRSKSLELWFNDLDFFIEKAINKKISIIYFLPVPEYIESAQACLFSANRKKCGEIDKKLLIKYYEDIYNNFKIIAEKYPALIFIDPFQTLCNTKKCFMSGQSYNGEREVSYYMDNNHLSLEGSKKFYRQLNELFKNLITSDSENYNFIPFTDIKNIKF